MLMKKSFSDKQVIEIGGCNVTTVRYPGDTVILDSRNYKNLQNMIDELIKLEENYS